MPLVAKIIDDALKLVNRAGDGTYRTRALQALNRAHRYCARRFPWEGLRKQENFLTNGTRFLVLPERVLDIIAVGDSTNARHLDAGDHWDRRAPGTYFQGVGGTAKEWRRAGVVPVTGQPSTDTRLRLQTAVSDGMRVLVRGLGRDTAASGTALELYPIEEILSMGGSGITLTANTYVEILSLEKDEATLTDLLVTDNVTGLRLARIPSWAARSGLQRVEFLHVPPANTSVRVDYYRHPDRITGENETLDASIPEDYIVWRTVGDLEWIMERAEAAQLAWARAEANMQADYVAEETRGDYRIDPHPWTPGYDDLEEPFGF
ncbi:MAG: hypothetical protein L0099_07280 [Acidobacteria bacterium]|nr:hypothetical protein [Acidobacteriota bacterium]